MVEKERIKELVSKIVGLLITIIVLLIVKAILVKLPAMENIVVAHISIATVASAVISLIILILVIIWGQDISMRTARILPTFPESEPLINKFLILIALIIAYTIFYEIFVPFLYQIGVPWLYPIIFLIAAIFPVYQLIVVITGSSGKIVDLFAGARERVISKQTIICTNCGAEVPMSKFCRQCGKELVAKTTTLNCPSCGKDLKPGAKFCIFCGAKFEEKVSVPFKCSQCGAPLTSEVIFCNNCGSKVEKIKEG